MPARSASSRRRAWPTSNVPPDAEINWLSAEQSNSSLIVGDVAMLKLFRRVAAGPHPEAEMGRYLTEQGFANTAPLLGEVVRVDPDGTRHALAIAQGFIRNQGDAWTWTLDLLLRGLSDLTGSAEGEAATESEQHEDYDAIATLLGRRLGEMHAVLARESDDPAFAPETAGDAVTGQWATQAEQQLAAAFDALSAQTRLGRGSAANDLAVVMAERDRLTHWRVGWRASGDGATLTRIHGDLHLGQVLVANGDVYIIDFEGEPAKPMELRRGKNHRLRDVAGMLRSFDYAAAVVQRKSLASHAHVADPDRDTFLRTFVEQATRSFLAGYGEVCPSMGEPAEHDLLQLFLLEKAAYEIAYEAANRPTWIDVPLHGLAQLIEQLVGAANERHGRPGGPATRCGGSARQRHAARSVRRARAARQLGGPHRSRLPAGRAGSRSAVRAPRAARLAGWRRLRRKGCSSAA